MAKLAWAMGRMGRVEKKCLGKYRQMAHNISFISGLFIFVDIVDHLLALPHKFRGPEDCDPSGMRVGSAG